MKNRTYVFLFYLITILLGISQLTRILYKNQNTEIKLNRNLQVQASNTTISSTKEEKVEEVTVTIDKEDNAIYYNGQRYYLEGSIETEGESNKHLTSNIVVVNCFIILCKL